MTPVEIDTKLAEAHRLHDAALTSLRSAQDAVRRSAGQKRNRDNWDGTWLDALSTLEASDNAWIKRTVDVYWSALHNEIDARKTVSDLDALYTGWSRFFLVLNNNGHVHRTMNCSTCTFTTRFGWLPQLSGLTEAEAVADQGEILCSVCFPSAPTAWTTGVSKAAVEARDARDAKKAAAAAKKAEKALGTVIRTRWERIETIAAAKSFLTNAHEWGIGTGDYTGETVALVAEVLAARVGTTVQDELNAARKRAEKRNR